jgi:transcriptional regulator with XRE-family HTH domain
MSRLLKDAGRNPAWLAEKAGVSRSTITRILNGDRFPSAETLVTVAPVFGMDLAQLVAETDAADLVDQAQQLVSRLDYEGAVRQVIEFERRSHDLSARLRDQEEACLRHIERKKELQKDFEACKQDLRDARAERDRARDEARRHEVEAGRYRAALARAVGDLARLHARVGEIQKEAQAGRTAGQVAALLAGVAAAVSVATYLGDPPPTRAAKKQTTARTRAR